jgi:hypothetical protein
MEPEQLGWTLKLALDAEAARRPPSPDGWRKIERRLRREPWRRAGIAAVSIAATAALVIGASQFAVGLAGRQAVRPGSGRPGQLTVVGTTRLPGPGFAMAAGYGAIWVVGRGATYEVDQATGRVVRKISTPGTAPGGCGSGVATGLGAVWITYGCRGMYRIDARTGQVTASIRVPRAGDAVAVANGLVWVPVYPGDLLRIQPRTGALTGRPIRIGYGEWRIVPGAGALWITSYGSGLGPVQRVDLASGAVRQFANPTITDVAAVGAGSLWTSQVQRVEPATGKVVASIFLPVLEPGDVAFWRGQVWALTLQATVAIIRIDPAINHLVGAPTRLAVSAGSIAASPTGLWVLSRLLFHLRIRR